ncbi:MAG: ABC transporter ATP-binding protein [Pyrinomonadaceae bacterium]
MTSEYNIKIDSLSFLYEKDSRGVPIIEDISFEVTNNEVFCILGTNGSGKSTLVNTVGGFTEPTSGSVQFLNTHQNFVEVPSVVAFVNQDYRQSNFPWASVIENIIFPLRFQAVDEDERTTFGIELLKRILPDINPWMKAYKLSGGQQQLISVARALISNPKVLLADEPLSAVNLIYSYKMIKLLEEYRSRQPYPVIWVSHNIDEAFLISDRLALLSRRERCFSRIFENPLPRPRIPDDLANLEVVRLKKEILNFLLSEA